jgi:hypothetical protein
MSEDRRLDNLQEEIKLMKGELKQSLASVRDYLLNMELPSSEISTILSQISDGEQKVTMSGALGAPATARQPGELDDALTETEESIEDELEPEGDDLLDLEKPEEDEADTDTETETEPEDGLADEDEELTSEDTQPLPEDDSSTPEDTSSTSEETEEDEQDEPLPLEPEMSSDEEQPMQEEEPMQNDRPTDDMTLSVPKVNMLANLINWVARANKEIGRDQIPTFLEVYGISGHLSPELKDVIIRLSEITEEDTEISSSTEIWSQAMLLLHGILTGGDAPLHPIIPSWNNEEKLTAEEEIIEVDKSKDKSIKLKLVLPDEDGEDKEFCINLTPEVNVHNRK